MRGREWSQRKEEGREEKGRKVCICDLHWGNKNQPGRRRKGRKADQGTTCTRAEYLERYVIRS